MSTIKTQSTTCKGNSFGNQKNLTGKGADILLSEINWLYCVALQGLVSALSTRETSVYWGDLNGSRFFPSRCGGASPTASVLLQSAGLPELLKFPIIHLLR